MDEFKTYSRDKLRNILDQNDDQVDELMKIFIETTPPLLKEMLDASEQENYLSCSKIAHRLKSSIQLWDIKHLEDDVFFIETNGVQSKNTELINNKIKNLNTQLLQVIEQMKNEI